MQKTKLLICITAFLLLSTAFAIIPAFSSQPPVDTSTYYIGTISQLRNVDPTIAYDTASGELIFNVYQNLIWFGDHKFVGQGVTSKFNDTDYDNLDPSSFVPVVAKYMPQVTMTNPGSTWVFQIRDDVPYQDWTEADGVTVHHLQKVTPEDVVYHFKRFFVQGSQSNPQWMFTCPMFGGPGYFDLDDRYDADFDTNGLQPIGTPGAGEMKAAADMDSHIFVSDGTNVTFVFDYDWPVTGIYQAFAQTWGCIEPMDWAMEHGCWNNTWYDGWSEAEMNFPSSSKTPLDQHTTRSKYASTTAEPAMCGTGPYKFTYWDTALQQWRADKFDDYWGGWAGNHVNTIIETGVDAWPTRKMMFLQGEFDSCAVPTSNMYDILDRTAPDGGLHTPIPGICLIWGQSPLSNDVIQYCFRTNDNPKFPVKINGVANATAFSNPHFRRAWNSVVNFTTYIQAAYYGEARHPASWWVKGLAPNYENASVLPWDYDSAFVVSELNAAGITSFETTVTYNSGNEGRRIYCEMVRDNFKAINPQYVVNVFDETWGAMLTDFQTYQLPVFSVGWLADFADPDNFARTYMYSAGAFSLFMRVSGDPLSPYVDSQIDLGAALPNNATRQAVYEGLQSIYRELAWAQPLVQIQGRAWMRDWVRNWEYNQLYTGGYYYFRYKTAAGSLKQIDLDVTGTLTAVVARPTTYIYKGQMRVGYMGGGIGNSSAQVQIYDIHVARTDAVAGLVAAVVGLQRNNETSPLTSPWNVPQYTRAFPNSTYVLLGPSSGATVRLWHYEQTSTTAQMVPNANTGVVWRMGARTDVLSFDAQDTNLANNYVAGDTLTAYKSNVGDINGDGIVDILDAITLAGVYGKQQGQVGYNADANLNTTPDPVSLKQIIDILDAITLANNFGKHNQP